MTPLQIASLIFCAGLLVGASVAHVFRKRKKYPIYRHVKSGNIYAVIGEGRLEADTRRCVIYTLVCTLDDPTPWVRSYNEFHDGRFELIGTVPK